MPEATALAALRRDIDRKPHKIKNVLMSASIRKAFFGEATNEAKAVKAFTKQPSNRSNALKKHPKVNALFSFLRKNSDNSLLWNDRIFLCKRNTHVLYYSSTFDDGWALLELWDSPISVSMVQIKCAYNIYVSLHQHGLMELGLGGMHRDAQQPFTRYQRLSPHQWPRPSTDGPW